MTKTKLMYRFMMIAVMGLIIYFIYMNFIKDPGASAFLSHKTGAKRPVQLPVWLPVMYVHVAFACLAMLTGLINFSRLIWEKRRRVHRWNGYAYLLSVVIVDVTSGYMAPYATGGKLTSIAFNQLNAYWLIVTIAALVMAKKKRIDRHRRWMLRSYVFCFTNVPIHFITWVCYAGVGLSYTVSYTIGVYGAIVLLVLLAELIVRTGFKQSGLSNL
ncbi:DUF2306 domain-containing protein [Paenibacillus doosanensis]|uniref:DUF2306 domain-containing protein n=1 Tax=Paenibacillus konkukensis TaxID=2020716 RepID=A0ABY4RTI2_9BACL|nr:MULTISPECIES: DUF2306 domain-containing protein [Paenibacillus]MCS7464856.1 DUF2306 domain-containing protein [Paenibacillus doosanensis]UQZ84838.1 hypothetical protein SK3146_04093 [Paenibacillus konkukensis]